MLRSSIIKNFNQKESPIRPPDNYCTWTPDIYLDVKVTKVMLMELMVMIMLGLSVLLNMYRTQRVML